MANMEKLERVQFATTLPGPKPICLVGTRSLAGVANLAPFSSITHLGSYPLLIGMVTRPDVVERNTLQNILDTKSWTLNHVTSKTLEQAHQCSARYPTDVSEFDATGLTELIHEGIIQGIQRVWPIKGNHPNHAFTVHHDCLIGHVKNLFFHRQRVSGSPDRKTVANLTLWQAPVDSL